MTHVAIRGLSGDSREIAQETLDDFATSLEGQLLLPSDEGFAEATSLWNAMIKKRPAVVVQPRTTQDVADAVNFVRANELELSIKGGGHNIAGLALSDGGVTLDMSGMRNVDVDPDAR